MVYRTIIHLNIELQIPVIYRADFGLRGFTPLVFLLSLSSRIIFISSSEALATIRNDHRHL